MWKEIVISLLIFIIIRVGIVIWKIKQKRTISRHIFSVAAKVKHSLMVVIGSGGHTAEILRLTGALNLKIYKPRNYVIANTDKISEDKVTAFEKENTAAEILNYSIRYIPRSREVKQSWLSTVISTLYASLYSVPLVLKVRPNLLLVNGPGTCVPICMAAFLLTLMGRKVIIIFVESLCRVTTMSMTGKILYYFADHLIVQWPELRQQYPETLYFGRLV